MNSLNLIAAKKRIVDGPLKLIGALSLVVTWLSSPAWSKTTLSGAFTDLGGGVAEGLSGTTTITVNTANDTNTDVTFYPISFNSGPNAASNVGLWSHQGITGQGGLGIWNFWDTSPENQGNPAADDAEVMTVTISFSETVYDPIIHLDRVGGNGSNGQFYSNSAIWTLMTPGLSMNKLAGNGQMRITGNQFFREPNVPLGTDNTGFYGGESEQRSYRWSRLGGAASLQIFGAIDQLEFQVTGVGVEGNGSDGIEMVFETTTIPAAEDVDLQIVKSRNYSGVSVSIPVTFTLQYNCTSTVAGGTDCKDHRSD